MMDYVSDWRAKPTADVFLYSSKDQVKWNMMDHAPLRRNHREQSTGRKKQNRPYFYFFYLLFFFCGLYFIWNWRRRKWTIAKVICYRRGGWKKIIYSFFRSFFFFFGGFVYEFIKPQDCGLYSWGLDWIFLTYIYIYVYLYVYMGVGGVFAHYFPLTAIISNIILHNKHFIVIGG